MWFNSARGNASVSNMEESVRGIVLYPRLPQLPQEEDVEEDEAISDLHAHRHHPQQPNNLLEEVNKEEEEEEEEEEGGDEMPVETPPPTILDNNWLVIETNIAKNVYLFPEALRPSRSKKGIITKYLLSNPRGLYRLNHISMIPREAQLGMEYRLDRISMIPCVVGNSSRLFICWKIIVLMIYTMVGIHCKFWYAMLLPEAIKPVVYSKVVSMNAS